MDVTEGCPTRRCAVFVEFNNGLSIVNTHFCGGKYDDLLFGNKNELVSESIVQAKNNALHKILDMFGNVTIIGGDFNGMHDQISNEQLFESYPLYQKMSNENQRQFAIFFQTPHILLRKMGYSPAYDERTVIKTAQIGPPINVPDWIYINSQTKHVIQEVIAFDAITKPNDISDHNAVSVTLNSIVPQSRIE
eukprot:130106_1